MPAPPYAAVEPFWKVIQRAEAESLPEGATSLPATLYEGIGTSTSEQITSALKYLGFLDQLKHPTQKLFNYLSLPQNERRQALSNILYEAYPYLFSEEFDLASASAEDIQEAFKMNGASGSTIKKSYAFFLVLAEKAGLDIRPEKRKATLFMTAIPTSREITQAETPKPVLQNENPDLLEWARKMMPPFDPNWPSERQDLWWQTFNKIVQKAK